MALPAALQTGLKLPVIAAPMFLVSGVELLVACCQAGIIGTVPALNQRSTQGLSAWLAAIGTARATHAQRTGEAAAAYGVNLVVHAGNPRLQEDLQTCIEHRVPLIITSLGAVDTLVQRVHDYGGVVLHDVTTLRHAEKAIAAGVDGLILVCAGAGGHAGLLNPFAFTAAVREFYTGTLVLAGCINHGHEIAAAQLLGADLAYMGTRFIATQESLASSDYQQMLLRSAASDVVYTPAVSGVPGNFLKPSLLNAGFDLAALNQMGGHAKGIGAELANHAQQQEAKAWRDVWSAGQGVGSIHDVPTVAALVTRLHSEYQASRPRFG